VNIPEGLDLTGRVAVVTGSGSPGGIGFAACRLLGSLGAAVVVTATSDRAAERAGELRASGVDAVGVAGDLTEPETADRIAAAAVDRWGRLDIVVNNAGMVSTSRPDTDDGGVETLDFDGWRASLSRNLDTAFLMTRAALPAMLRGGWGRIVMVSSVTGPVMAMRDDAAYAAAKAGMVGLCRSVAVDVADRGVTANTVAPGWIATTSQTDDEVAEGRATPVGRSGTAEETAWAVAWLCTPGAAYVTGQCLVVDGGNSIREQRALHG
jgi:3-oxoacyl-[acyl-carrier protein] reductase